MFISFLYKWISGKKIWNRYRSYKEVVVIPDNSIKKNIVVPLLLRYQKEKNRGIKVIAIKENMYFRGSNEYIESHINVDLLDSAEMCKLIVYLTSKVNVLGESIFKNVVVISYCCFSGQSSKLLVENQLFDEEYVIWSRIFHKHREYSD